MVSKNTNPPDDPSEDTQKLDEDAIREIGIALAREADVGEAIRFRQSTIPPPPRF